MVIDPKDFTRTIAGGTHLFGVSPPDGIIEGLLKIVAAVADGRLSVQSINIKSDVSVDNYLMHEFILRYAEREEPLPAERQVQPDRLRALYGDR